MRRSLAAGWLAFIVLACSGSGLSGKYETDPGSGYGFEFEGETVYSHTGDDTARGTCTVDGSAVRICISFLCTDLQLVGDCLIQQDGGTYCKE
jgi:hypothetical protein